MTYTILVTKPDRGRYSGGDYKISSLSFRDERKARDHYTDMLVRYPDCNVEFIENRMIMTDKETQDAIRNMSEEQQDILFTLIVSAAFGADPWATEDYLYDRGIIKTTTRHGL